MPVAIPGQVTAVKPTLPGATPTPVSPVKPVLPGAVVPVSPARPVTPGAVVPVTPGAVSPLRPMAVPAAAIPVAGQSKSGTSVIKTAPPKETARITVKPSLPSTAARPAGAVPVTKPPGDKAGTAVVAGAAGAVAAVAAVKASETKPKTAAAPATVTTTSYADESEGSTLYSTIAAGVLAVVTWGTAAILAYYSLSS